MVRQRSRASSPRFPGTHLGHVQDLPLAHLHLAAAPTMSKSQSISTDIHKQLLAGLNIFHPSRLVTEDDITVAVNVLEGSLDHESIGPIILCSLQPEHPYVFEFIVSFVSKGSAKLLSRFVLDSIPPDAGFQASLEYKILSRLSHTLSRLSYPSGQQPEHLDEYRQNIEIAPALLEDLSKLLGEGFLDKAEAEGRTNKRNTQRGKTQRSKVVSSVHAEINDRLFRALGREAPRSRDAAEQLVKSIIDTQKDILKSFITLIRTPETARLVRSAYFRENTLQGNLSMSDEQDNVATWSAIESSPPSLATTANQIQADLYFESATGFGKWRILCSGSCLSDLARDGAQSNSLMKRLEELSLGHFSEANQMPLTRDSPIEIYRAQLPGNVRLVYHIDVIHEFGKDYETQVIRILGIYTMDQLNRKDWDKHGKYRARKGRDHMEKCRARLCRHGFYFDPVRFDSPVTLTGAVFVDPETPEKGDMEGVDEIHRLLELEQYSILSQSVVRDILKGHNYPRVFHVSHEEKKVIESTRSSFVLGRSGTGKTTVIVFKIFGIERAWQNQGCVGPRPRQLFITKSRLLAEKVEEDYVNLLNSLSAGSDAPLYVSERIRRWNARQKKVNFNPHDIEGGRDDLPNKFSELRDGDFPLFLTMDALCSLLEADMKPTPSSSSDHKDLVTYDVFKRVYWSQLPSIKGLSPSIAFSEFLGTIKGSEKSLEYTNRALDREAYENLRNAQRVDYTLFEAYQKLKLKRGERDLADRTHRILNELKENGVKGELVDFVYVDEVQDLLLIDTRLIISLCRNPDGLLWAGDTAQTISIGSTFTFKQLGASVYRYQRSIRALRGTPRQPEGFQLLKNYRSHGGIVKCANAIIQLLQRFPGAIDPLRPEAGVVGRELPKIFHGESLPEGRDFFLSKSERLSSLGHNQCIIVRDEAARQSFRTEVGRIGVTLTLFNSKGLEYDDVILYNFFEGSVSKNLWEYLTDEDQHKLKDLKYAPLIHELKCLYVAITRAKHRLWIVDYSDACEPIMRCLLDRGLVVTPNTTSNPLEPFVNKSTSSEWSEEGNRLLNHREFEEAVMAFDNAGDNDMAAVAMAYQCQEVACDTPEYDTKRRREAFVSAGKAFEHCAGIARDTGEERAHYAAAARCYAEIKYHQDAVRALERAKMLKEAASYRRDNNIQESTVSVTKKNEAKKVDSRPAESVEQGATSDVPRSGEQLSVIALPPPSSPPVPKVESYRVIGELWCIDEPPNCFLDRSWLGGPEFLYEIIL
ncbi:P-loop containing nucleoside triphosphate hydrolase protein [Russula compacta]|nr:P-loop containing nucleoside triphosphate hydrolase protein [Russula compacta]